MRAVLGFAAGLFVAFMVAVHDPRLMGMLGVTAQADPAGGGDGCPFGYDQPPEARSAPSMTAMAQAIVARTRTAMLASVPERPALGFALGETTRTEILTWAARHAVTCDELRDGSSLECSNVPVGALTVDPAQLSSASAWFEFSGDKLVRVKTLRRSDLSVQVEGAFERTRNAITARAGAPTATSGQPALLARGVLRQSSAEFAYRNYVASVRATNLGRDGFALTESYAAR